MLSHQSSPYLHSRSGLNGHIREMKIQNDKQEGSQTDNCLKGGHFAPGFLLSAAAHKEHMV